MSPLDVPILFHIMSFLSMHSLGLRRYPKLVAWASIILRNNVNTRHCSSIVTKVFMLLLKLGHSKAISKSFRFKKSKCTQRKWGKEFLLYMYSFQAVFQAAEYISFWNSVQTSVAVGRRVTCPMFGYRVAAEDLKSRSCLVQKYCKNPTQCGITPCILRLCLRQEIEVSTVPGMKSRQETIIAAQSERQR